MNTSSTPFRWRPVAVPLLSIFLAACSFPDGARERAEPAPEASVRTEDPADQSWTITFGSESVDRVTDIAPAAGGFYAAGVSPAQSAYRPLVGASERWQGDSGNQFVARFDARGRVVWGRIFQLDSNVTLRGAGDEAYLVRPVRSATDAASRDVQLTRFDREGAETWTSTLASGRGVLGSEIAVAVASGGGAFTHVGLDSAVLSKLDASGQVLWSLPRPHATLVVLAGDDAGGVVVVTQEQTPGQAVDPAADRDLVGDALSGAHFCFTLERIDASGRPLFRRWLAPHRAGSLRGVAGSVGPAYAMAGPSVARPWRPTPAASWWEASSRTRSASA